MLSLLLAVAAAPFAWAITPKLMLGAPRRGEALPNPTGEWAVFSVTTYDWDQHESSGYWELLNVKTGKTSLLFNSSDVSEVWWAGATNTSLLYINGTNDDVEGGVTLYTADALKPNAT
jgi:hypothetical protein